MTAVARVLIDSPLPQLDRLFDYAVPPELAAEAVPGARVRVPLRSAGRVVDGYLVELGELDPDGRPLSELDAVVSPTPVLTPALYALARRAATDMGSAYGGETPSFGREYLIPRPFDRRLLVELSAAVAQASFQPSSLKPRNQRLSV